MHTQPPASTCSSIKRAAGRRLEGRAWHTLGQVDRAPLTAARYLIREGVKARAHGVPAAELGGLEATDDVLERGGHDEVLLLQPQLLPLEELGTV